MQATWAQPCWVYDLELLGYYLRRPSVDPDLLVGLEDEGTGDLVAYCAYMPLSIHLEGRSLRAVFGSFLTTALRTQGRGAARALQVRLLTVSMSKGYDIYLAFCEVGAASNQSAIKSAAALDLVTSTVAHFPFLALPASVIRARLPAPCGPLRTYCDADRVVVSQLRENGEQGLTLRRYHDPRDYRHRFEGPRARSYVYAPGGNVRAFAHVLLADVLDGGRRFQNAYVQDFEAGDLPEAERRQFLIDVLHGAEREGCHLVIAPSTGYLPDDLLGSLGFRKTARRLNLMITPLHGGGPAAVAAEIKEFCLDVF